MSASGDHHTAATMLTRTGRVVSAHASHIVVRFERESACSSCRAAKACGGNISTSDLVLPQPANHTLYPGDLVQVGVAEGSALRSTIIAYITPLAGLLTGMALASVIGLSDGLVALASLLGLGIGFFAMRRLALRPGNRITPILLEANTSGKPKENHS